MTKEGSTIIVSFMIPGARVLVLGYGHIKHIVKLHYFFFNIFSQAWFRQTQYIVIITNEKSTKIVNFNDLRARVSCARAWTYKSYSENKVIQIEFQISGKDVETPNLYSPVVFLFVQQQKN